MARMAPSPLFLVTQCVVLRALAVTQQQFPAWAGWARKKSFLGPQAYGVGPYAGGLHYKAFPEHPIHLQGSPSAENPGAEVQGAAEIPVHTYPGFAGWTPPTTAAPEAEPRQNGGGSDMWPPKVNPPAPPRCNPMEFTAKEFDIIIYGATGIVGQMAAEYSALHQADKPLYALAGRDEDKLNDVRSRLPGLADVNVISLEDGPALVKLAQRTRTIINLAGPCEAVNCENLIRAALMGCSHYIDASVETTWMAEMFGNYSSVAKGRGVAIVQGAGFNSLAADLLTILAGQRLAADGYGPPSDIVMAWTKLNGGVSGTFSKTIGEEWVHYGPLDNPYILAPHARKQSTGMNEDLRQYHDTDTLLLHMRLHPYPYSTVDVPVMTRSMALQFPKQAVSIREVQNETVNEQLQSFYADSHIQDARPNIYAKQGEGPPRYVMDAGSFAGQSVACRDKDGRCVFMELNGQGDPSFVGTSTMMVELAVGLAQQGLNPEGTPGFPTPSLALGPEALQERLQKVGGGAFLNIRGAAQSQTPAYGEAVAAHLGQLQGPRGSSVLRR